MACIIGTAPVARVAPSRPRLPGRPRWRHAPSDGPRAVLDALKSLPDRYIVFCSYPVPTGEGSDSCEPVDYLVVGPTGVFAVAGAEHPVNVVEPARRNVAVRKEVTRAAGCAAELADALSGWSGGTLDDVAITPIVAYTHMGAYVVSPREGDVRVIPVKWLRSEVLDERKNPLIGPQAAWRVARMLFLSLADEARSAFDEQLRRCGEALDELARWTPPAGAESLGLERM